MKHMSLKAWIDQAGRAHVARLLDVDKMTVRCWHKGRGYPKVTHMRKIKRLTKGMVGYSQIIDGGRKS